MGVADDAMAGEIYGISKSLQIAIVLVVLMCAICCGLVFWVKTGRRKRKLPPPPPRKRTQESAHSAHSARSSQIVDIYSVRDRRQKEIESSGSFRRDHKIEPDEFEDEYSSEEDDANLYGHEEYLYRRRAIL